MLINGAKRQGPMATLVTIVAIAILSVAACKTTAPALGPEAPFAPAAGLPSVGGEPGVAAETGSITGRVIDAQSSQPIQAAQVFIAALDQTGRWGGTGPRFGVLSRENGTYILENVPVGTHAVTVLRIRYRRVTFDVTVAAGQTTAFDFRVTPEAQ
jgi:hypothetical protein